VREVLAAMRSARGTPSARGAAEAAHRALAELRARPWHVALGAIVVGLIAGPRAPVAALVAAVLLPFSPRAVPHASSSSPRCWPARS